MKPGLSRRNALLATLLVAPAGCGPIKRKLAAWANGRDVQWWNGLRVVRIAGMKEDERGGSAVVVLHGYTSTGDSMIALGSALKRPGARFFIPMGPFAAEEGRAWWHMNPKALPPHADSDRLPPEFRPTPEVVAARGLVQALVATIVDRYAPATMALVGYSQKTMLALDVELAGTPDVDRVVAMSGILLVDSVTGLSGPRATVPRFLLSHGRSDRILPFAGATRAKELLEKHGFPVTWRPFDGGHEIPDPLVPEIDRFLFAPAG